MPPGGEESARAFYEGVLGIPLVPKPPVLAARGGVWFEDGDLRVHLGVEPEFRPAKKAHPAFRVRDLDALVVVCRRAGHEVTAGDGVPGMRQAYVADPFGNRIELLRRSTI
jgi:catechol 2,3-dioxygenase-like lactoylglutathione lyase family enzyme